MRILFLAQILPYPLDSGVKIRTYYTLRQLAGRHEVTLACFVRADNTPDEIAHLGAFCRAVHTVPMHRSRLKDARWLVQSTLAGRSFIISRDTVPEMQRLVDGLLRQAAGEGRPFDAIHSDQLWMAQYALRGGAVKKVLDQHNAVFMIPMRLAQYERNPVKRGLLELEWRKLARHEAAVCSRFDHVIWVTEEDRNALERWNVPTLERFNASVVPICVDPSTTAVVPREGDCTTVFHVGTMFWPPNVEGVLWLAREVFPRLRDRVPDARLCLVGKNPPRPVRALAADPGIEVTGYVADVRPYAGRSAAFVIPVRAGGGMRVKILDGWLWGVPMVSTTVGAEGIDIRPGENILIADDPASFAEAVVRVMHEPDLARRLAVNGRQWVEARYDWRRTYHILDDVYERL